MTTTTKEISNSDDVIDVRDVIARFEELETELDDAHEDSETNEALDLRAEFDTLKELLSDLESNGGDEEWRGAWYPVTLVRDSYFRDYAQEEAEDLDLVKSDARWPYTCIDWRQAAEELKQDYSTVEFDGVTYWYR
jgi:hypothetical protein